MIETQKLSKYYGNLAALVELDLKIEQGDIFGFIGPNGAGKTTTMRILATLLEPTRGRAFIDGLDVSEVSALVAQHKLHVQLGLSDELPLVERQKIVHIPEFAVSDRHDCQTSGI